MKIEEALLECSQMQAFLEIECSKEITEMVDRVNTINVIMARSGEMLADAKMLQEEAMCHTFEQENTYIKGLQPSVATKYLTSKIYTENRLVNWIDRINATCKHQGDNLRTLISYMKSQLELERKGY